MMVVVKPGLVRCPMSSLDLDQRYNRPPATTCQPSHHHHHQNNHLHRLFIMSNIVEGIVLVLIFEIFANIKPISSIYFGPGAQWRSMFGDTRKGEIFKQYLIKVSQICFLFHFFKIYKVAWDSTYSKHYHQVWDYMSYKLRIHKVDSHQGSGSQG